MALPDPRVRGGPPSHLYLLRDSLVKKGVDVRSVLYGGRTHDESRWVKIAGRFVDLVRFPFVIARHRPDVVHLNSAFDRRGVARDVFFVTLARMLGQRVLIKFHGSDLDYLRGASGLRRRMIDAVLGGARRVCVLSEQEKEAFQNHYPQSRFVPVKNALDLSRYKANADFRTEHGIDPKKPLLLFIARFIGTKGLRETIEALPMILEANDVHALLVGDGPVRADCEELADRIGVTDHVTFTGYIPEDRTVDAYLASDILVFPSYHQEGMPMVIFHALACGLPIITTRIRAAADWLGENVNGLFVPPRDSRALANAVTGLLDDAPLRAAMAQNNRRLALRFDRSAVADEFMDLYQSMVNDDR